MLGAVDDGREVGVWGLGVLVASEEDRLTKLRTPIEVELSAHETPKVRFFAPEELFAFVQAVEVADLQQDRTMRGQVKLSAVGRGRLQGSAGEDFIGDRKIDWKERNKTKL
jgi:hypothetical protein